MPSPIAVFGASLVKANFSIGLGGQTGQAQFTVVEDPAVPDTFAPPEPGEPSYFTISGLTFNGIIQKYDRIRSINGNPTFEVIVSDPKEILDCVQVVVGAYDGLTSYVDNVINAYGYWEDAGGFGYAQSNESGMSWDKISAAVVNLTTGAAGPYGGPIVFRGFEYSVDLSELPASVPNYRVGGSAAMSLLEIISIVCEENNLDFFVELDGLEIVLRVISRLTQPPLGTLSTYADAGLGTTLISNRAGVELRNEQTGAFLIGGAKTDLYLTPTYTQFWGYSASGTPITGVKDMRFWEPRWTGVNPALDRSPFPVLFRASGTSDVVAPEAPGANWAYYPVTGYRYERMTLNASSVADIVGSSGYICTDLEMRAALQDYSSWAAFIKAHGLSGVKPFVFSEYTRPFDKAARNDWWAKKDLINDADAALVAAIQLDIHNNGQRLFNFVRGHAEEYLGKTYIVPASFLSSYIDEDSGQTNWNYEVTDGGYLPDGSSPLGLSLWNEDKFRATDGRFRAFAKYDPITGADLSSLDPTNDAIEGSASQLSGYSAFVSAQAEAGVVPTTPLSFLIKIARPLYQKALDAVGNRDEVLRAAFQARPQEERAQRILRGEGGWASVSIHPAPMDPYAFAVPIQSNVDTYGPWYIGTTPGKVRVEHDSSLVPWNYGGFEFMNAAAEARVTDGVSTMQISESGEVEEVGLPSGSLGDILSANGPNITNISIDYSISKMSTTYGFRLYTPKFGTLGRGNAEKIRKNGVGLALANRAARAYAKERMTAVDAAKSATGRSAMQPFAKDAPKAIKRQSPHDYLVGVVTSETGAYYDAANTEGFSFGVTTATAEEAMGMIYPDDPTGYKRSAAISLDGLFVPYSTSTSGDRIIPKYQETHPFNGLLNQFRLSPWRRAGGTNIAGFTRNQTYESGDGIAWKNSNAVFNTGLGEVRALALRAPLMVAGWGYDINGKPTYTTQSDNRTFKPTGWRVGPMDMHWDPYKGTWSSRDIVYTTFERDELESLEFAGLMTTNLGHTSYSTNPSQSGHNLLLKREQIDVVLGGGRNWCGPFTSGDNILGTYCNNIKAFTNTNTNIAAWLALRGKYPYYLDLNATLIGETGVAQLDLDRYGSGPGTLSEGQSSFTQAPKPPRWRQDVSSGYWVGQWIMGGGIITPSGNFSQFGGPVVFDSQIQLRTANYAGSIARGKIFVNEDRCESNRAPYTPTSPYLDGMQFTEGLLNYINTSFATGNYHLMLMHRASQGISIEILPKGTDGQFLKMVSGKPAWSA